MGSLCITDPCFIKDKLLYRRLTPPSFVDRYVAVGDLEGYVHFLSPESGEIIGRVATDGSQVLSLLPVQGGVLVQTAKGTVALIRL